LQKRLYAFGLQQLGHFFTRFVATDHAHQRRLGAKGCNIARDIGGTTEAFITALYPYHWYRSLGGNTVYLTKPVAVEHDVTNHQYAPLLY
jgi:hypothetical protein